MPSVLASLARQCRKLLHLSQPALAATAGVGRRFVRELKQGKPILRLNKVNQVLRFFGHRPAPVLLDRALLTHTAWQKPKRMYKPQLAGFPM